VEPHFYTWLNLLTAVQHTSLEAFLELKLNKRVIFGAAFLYMVKIALQFSYLQVPTNYLEAFLELKLNKRVIFGAAFLYMVKIALQFRYLQVPTNYLEAFLELKVH